MSEGVAERIRRAIRDRGPITFAEFMAEALYGPGGFYESTPVGDRGHFVTSPHVHPVFSRLVGAAVEELWRALGRSEPLRVVEVGAGDGTLGRELVDGFARAGIALDYAAVEESEGAREALAALEAHVARSLVELDPLDGGVVLANELLDNLPFRRLRRRGDRLVEVRVGLDREERLVEVEAPAAPDALDAAVDVAGDGEIVVPTGAFAFVDELGTWMRRGYALLVDYGAPSGPAGEVHGYRDHRVLSDVLSDPGSVDVTAGVDLGAVSARARASGLDAFGPVRQSAALSALGVEEWMRAELARQGDLLTSDRGTEAVRAWEGRNRARLLVDPAGLGGLWWLLLSTPGLPEPSWLATASSATSPAR
jgi:SAM-dependent MidA family methyltransferase